MIDSCFAVPVIMKVAQIISYIARWLDFCVILRVRYVILIIKILNVKYSKLMKREMASNRKIQFR